MQLVLSGNRVIAHGENFLSMGGVVINTETGAKYENATVAECENCPSDIGEVGYEYHAGAFVPCAPYGKGNGEGYVMEVCECATPRNSGIPIKELSRMHLLWENPEPSNEFGPQTISISGDYDFLLIEFSGSPVQIIPKGQEVLLEKNSAVYASGNTVYQTRMTYRTVKYEEASVVFGTGNEWVNAPEIQYAPKTDHYAFVPRKIYGMKFLGI